MSLIESGFQPNVFHTPDTGAGSGLPNSSTPDNSQNVSFDEFFQQLNKDRNDIAIRLLFELRLDELGLLKPLEKTGILPPQYDCPNPYDLDLEPEKNEQWWQTHEQEGIEWNENFERRQEVLGLLYVGLHMNRLRRSNNEKKQDTK